jgi:hypothetical protein
MPFNSGPRKVPKDGKKDAFSEFSYGFALTNELIAIIPVLSAPTFPSLREEGKSAGYDVKLDRPGKALFIQFKLSYQLQGDATVEFKEKRFVSPFYRMSIRSRTGSRQHDLLTKLEEKNRKCVYYMAPAFHLQSDLNKHFKNRTVASNSRRVKPSFIQAPKDGKPHWVSFQTASGKKIYSYSDAGKQIETDHRSLYEIIREEISALKKAHTLGDEVRSLLEWFGEVAQQEGLPSSLHVANSGANPILLLAEMAQVWLGATLFIAQEPNA